MSAAGDGVPPRRGRGRRRADEVRREVLDAAGELLFAEGMGAFTIDKVANRSGASKMTIYKWWPSKGALALDGYFAEVEPELAFPDTGDIEADLRAQLHALVHVVRDSPAGQVIAELIGQAQTDPGLKAAYLQSYSSPRRALAVEVARELAGGSFAGRNVAVLGAAFKPDTDDVRDSPALDVARTIRSEGAVVRVHDPRATYNARRACRDLDYVEEAVKACEAADVVLHLTEWREYRDIDPEMPIPMEKIEWMKATLATTTNLPPLDLAKIVDADVRVRAHTLVK